MSATSYRYSILPKKLRRSVEETQTSSTYLEPNKPISNPIMYNPKNQAAVTDRQSKKWRGEEDLNFRFRITPIG